MIDLTTLEIVKEFAKIPTDTTSSDQWLQQLITGTSEQVSLYLDRDFEEDLYNHTEIGECDQTIILDNTPINNIVYSAQTGSRCVCSSGSAVIDLTYNGTQFPSIFIGENSETILINTDTTAQVLPIGKLDTITDLTAAIDALADWTAETQSGTERLPARAITEIFQNTRIDGNDEYSFSVVCPLNLFHVQIGGRTGLSKASQNLNSTYVVLYNGGYANTEALPPGLQQLVGKIVADVYEGSLHDGSLKSEKVGDYTYVLNTDAVYDYIQSRKSMLSSYKNLSV